MIDLTNLQTKSSLNPILWDSGVIKENISAALMSIAQNFFEELNIDEEYEDIRITGSMAGYNWTDLSDIDVHIIFDFAKFGGIAPLMKEFLSLKRFQWNRAHDIEIYGHEVELYIQDESEPHYSAGQYSLLRREWVEEPKKMEKSIDFSAIKAKTRTIIADIDLISELFDKNRYEQANEEATRLVKKLKRLRKCGLEQGGIYSVENLAFKALRNANYIDKLMELRSDSYDRKMSLGDEEQIMVKIDEIKRKVGNKWCLYSKNKTKSGKRRKLGCYNSKKGVAKREKQVHYFKNLGENMAEIERYFNKNISSIGEDEDERDAKVREAGEKMTSQELLDPDHPAPWETIA